MRLGADITTTRRAIWLSMTAIWLFWVVLMGIGSDARTMLVMLIVGVIIVPLNYLQIVFALWLGRTLERIIWKTKENQHEQD